MNLAQLAYGQVRFRPLEPEDLEFLYKWENDPDIWKVSNTFTPFSRFILKQYIQESHRDIFEARQLRLIIQDLEGKPAGAIDLFDFEPFHQRAGLGILIHSPEDRQKGLATDSLQLMLNYAKEVLGLHQLYANIPVNNPASIALFEKAGFQCTGTKKDWIKTTNGWLDEMTCQRIL